MPSVTLKSESFKKSFNTFEDVVNFLKTLESDTILSVEVKHKEYEVICTQPVSKLIYDFERNMF